MNISNRLLPIGALVVALVIIIAGLSVLFNNNNPDEVKITKQKVTITMPAGLTANIYPADQEHGDQATEPKPLQTVKGSQTITIDTGAYQIASVATGNYDEASTTFTVVDKPLKVTLDPNYSEAKLASLLASEQAAIHAAISKQVPKVNTYYKIENGWLYQHGDWYATKLTYKGPATYDSDTLKLVAKKENGAWKLVTKPPVLNVSIVLYPEIPPEIASDINNFR